jgi:hypothetical protein
MKKMVLMIVMALFIVSVATMGFAGKEEGPCCPPEKVMTTPDTE